MRISDWSSDVCSSDLVRGFIPKFGTNEGGTMARNTSVSLGDHFDQFIAGQVDSGRYGSASEVVRAGLRLLETTESKLEVLRNALIAGERSGRAKRSEEHTSELQPLMRNTYAVLFL